MLGLGIVNPWRHGGLPDFAHGAALAMDFVSGFASRAEQPCPLSGVLSLTRASPAWAMGSDGSLSAFGPGAMRLTDQGLQLGQGATRLHGEFPTNAILNSGVSVTAGSTVRGMTSRLFTTTLAGTWRGAQTGEFAITSGTRLFWRARFRMGSQNEIGLSLQNVAGTSTSTLTYANATWSAATTALGTHTIISTRDLGDGIIEVSASFMPSVTASDIRLGMQIRAAEVGQGAEIFGAQVTTAWSDWIMGGASSSTATVTQNADDMRLDIAGTVLSSGFMMRIDGTILHLPSSGFDRFYQADDGSFVNRASGYVVGSSGAVTNDNYAANVGQGFPNLGTATAGPFSFVAAHGPNYIGGAWNGAVVTPDTVASYVTPTRLSIGSAAGGNALPLAIRRLVLWTGAPSTALVSQRVLPA